MISLFLSFSALLSTAHRIQSYNTNLAIAIMLRQSSTTLSPHRLGLTTWTSYHVITNSTPQQHSTARSNLSSCFSFLTLVMLCILTYFFFYCLPFSFSLQPTNRPYIPTTVQCLSRPSTSSLFSVSGSATHTYTTSFSLHSSSSISSYLLYAVWSLYTARACAESQVPKAKLSKRIQKKRKNTKMCLFFSLHTYIIIYDMSCQFLPPFDVPSRLCILRFTSSSRVIVI